MEVTEDLFQKGQLLPLFPTAVWFDVFEHRGGFVRTWVFCGRLSLLQVIRGEAELSQLANVEHLCLWYREHPVL